MIKSIKDKVELIELSKLIRRKIRQDINNYDTSKILKIMEESNSLKKFRKEIYPHRSLIPKMSDKKGEATHDREKIVNIATQFYGSLYSMEELDREEVELVAPWGNFQDMDEDPIPPFLEREIYVILKQLKTRRAVGPDKISNYIKTFTDEITPTLTQSFNKILEHEITPYQWKTAEIYYYLKKVTVLT